MASTYSWPVASSMRAKYVVGADGGRSAIRKAAGIEFPGWEATTSALIAEVKVTEELPTGITYDASGLHALGFMEDGRTVRVVTGERELGMTTEPTLADLAENLTSVYGTDFGVHRPTWISRFTDATRQAAAYRSGRVLLAGDAAHIHSPAGGQGIGLGIQDAMNLGWKLAQVVKGLSPETLLDTYHSERHPADARALEYSKAMSALQRHDARIAAVRELMDELVTWTSRVDMWSPCVSGLDVRYDLGEGHPLLGRRMPDLDLVVDGGATRVYSLLHEARPVLINFGRSGSAALGPWTDRVRLVDATYVGAWELPGDRRGRRSGRGPGATRRPRGLGGRRDSVGAGGSVGHLVRRADGAMSGRPGSAAVRARASAGSRLELSQIRVTDRPPSHPLMGGERTAPRLTRGGRLPFEPSARDSAAEPACRATPRWQSPGGLPRTWSSRRA